jgi:hypothetical protein
MAIEYELRKLGEELDCLFKVSEHFIRAYTPDGKTRICKIKRSEDLTNGKIRQLVKANKRFEQLASDLEEEGFHLVASTSSRWTIWHKDPRIKIGTINPMDPKGIFPQMRDLFAERVPNYSFSYE